MTERRASCSCGQLSIACQGEPVRISVCHCLECQKRTGSAFGAQVRFSTELTSPRGDSTVYTRVCEDGDRIHFHFCPKCGSTVYYLMESQPELTAITLGTFADPQFPAPRFSVYEDRMHSWVSVPGSEVEHFN
ncbi:GFA family protein [bacterium]|nr:GFA family protein [bacterium]